jgi:predicted SAM-dependent methyltransferase
MLKLHIGCAEKRLVNFVNIDVRETCATDLIAEAWNIPGIGSGSVSEIYSRHMLEHLDPNDARRALSHWRELLGIGGKLNLIVPDLEFHACQLIGAVKSKFPDQNEHALAGFYGWRDESRGGRREDAHRWGYTHQSLKAELERFGFIDVVRLAVGKDTEPWHLNLSASAG